MKAPVRANAEGPAPGSAVTQRPSGPRAPWRAVPVMALLLGISAVAGPVSFPTRVLPVLTKAGCNSGGCHGAATGQGGFRLSLLGCDPEQDHLALTRELGARRISIGAPAESLFLRKATGRTEHEGGRRFGRASAEAALLTDWVGAGAPYGPRGLRVISISVSPAGVLAAPAERAAQLKVSAQISDGSAEDVTALALYTSNDDSVATVDRLGALSVHGPGSAGVMVRYAGQVACTLVDCPADGPEPAAALARLAPGNFVDELLLARLRRLRLPPSGLAEDATFLRRVSIDLASRLPSPEEALDFLRRPPSSEKRRKAIDRLLESEEFTDLWTLHLADQLLVSGRRGTEAGARAWHRWLRNQVAANRPWNELVRELITAEGDVSTVGPANFLMLANDPRDLAEQVGAMFLGVQIGCARCHTHPGDRWTQQDYYRFAAHFARVRREGGVVREGGEGELEDPRTGQVLAPAPLGAELAANRPEANRRSVLAGWLVAPDNRQFARALVNRVWKHLLGRGLVEPVDDLRPTNPASHPELLEALATHFIRSGYDLRNLVRTIAGSRTYQLSPETVPGNGSDGRLHSHALVKTPPAQVLLDLIAQATGVPETFPDQPDVTRAVRLVGVQTPSPALDVFGRCARDRGCSTASAGGGGLAQALHLLNGPTVNGRLTRGVVADLLSREAPADAAVRTLFLRTLSRPPRPDELTEWTALLETVPDRAEAFADLLWSLLNSREFLFIR